ncbi:MAG: creatininase family protein [Halobacteriales archaeon]|nr:creatininase family protein [Halobacteriales archaeon]
MRLTDAAWATRPYGEVVELAERDGSLLVVPVGSLEQHGYHLPVATDTLLVDAVAHGAAEATDAPVLVTPPVWTGLSPHHLPFGGTVSLEREDLEVLLEGIADTALGNGFDALLLLNGHGGNAALIDAVVVSIGADHPDVEVTGLTYFALAAEIADDVRDSAVGGTGHGGEFETSLMLHLHPELVDMDRAEGTMMEAPYEHSRTDIFHGGPLSVYRPFTDFSDSGVIGDPTLGTAEKGERLFEHLRAEHAALFEAIAAEARDDGD